MQSDTMAVHAGFEALSETPRPLTPPIYQSSVFVFDDLARAADVTGGASPGYSYARIGHPNADMLSAAVAALEGAGAGATAASGMGAILAALLAARGEGGIAIAREIYGGSVALARSFLSPLGVECSFFDSHDPQSIPEGAGAVLVESCSNPLGRLSDVAALADAAHRRGARLVVDNTFATPYLVRPLEHGADLVVHSATKFLSGHGDVILGALAGSEELVAAAQSSLTTFGATPDPFAAWLALRGLRTFGVRMERAVENAAQIAKHLASHPKVRKVHHASLGTHPDRALAERYFAGRGPAILAFDLADEAQAEKFVSRLAWIRYAPSLGDVATILLHPATTSHRQLSAQELAELGITPGTVRLSVGIEATQDLLAEIDRGLAG